MITVILVIHLLLAVGLVGVILLQRSEGGALGIGGGGGLMSGRAAGNLLTRTTAILAAAFIVTSLTLSLMANNRPAPTSIIEQTPSVPQLPTMPAQPATPAQPAAPLAR